MAGGGAPLPNGGGGTVVPMGPAQAPPAQDLGGQEIDIGALGRILYRRRRLATAVFAVTVLVGGVNYLWERTLHPIYTGGFRMLISDPISRDTPNSSTQIEGLARSGLSVRMGDLIEALKSPAAVEPVAKRLGLDPGAISAALGIELVGGTSGILSVNLNWGNPTQGERILKELSKDYLQYSLRERQQRLTQGLAFLDKQAPALQRQVVALQKQLAEFRIRHNFIDPTERAVVLVNQSRGVEDYLTSLRLKDLQLDAQEASVRAGQIGGLTLPLAGSTSAPAAPASSASTATAAGAGGGMASGSGSAAATGRGGLGRIGTNARTEPPRATPGELVNTLTGVERDLKLAESVYTDSSPMVQELRERQRVLKSYIQQQALEGIASARLNNSLDRQLNERKQADLKAQFSRDPDLIRRYEELQQRLSVARDGLGSYIRARESFRLEVAQRTLPWEILTEPGFSYVPGQPDPKRAMFLSVVAGAVLGVLAALLRNRLDHVFHSPREVQAQIGLPLLGTVPYLPIETGRSLSETIELMDQVERFALRESLRNLSTSFRMLRADRPVRMMSLTSTTQREGKTTITALFGLTLSELGLRVLLVDADLRRPSLHRRLGLANERGLTNALTESDVQLAPLIQTVTDRLDLLTAGPPAPDATKLLNSERCGGLVEEIRQLPGYDIVLFDTPPALQLADSLLLSTHLDGLLFLVSIQKVDRSLPDQAIERIRETGVDLLGLVTNQSVQPVGLSPYGYGYGYGSGYGYGYYGLDNYSRYVPTSLPGADGGAAAQSEAGDQAGAVATLPPPPKRGSSGRGLMAVLPGPTRKVAHKGVRRLMNWLDGRR